MARLPRFNVTQHIVQCGNNRREAMGHMRLWGQVFLFA